MESRAAMRVAVVTVLATVYAGLAMYVAGVGVAEVFAPLSRAVTLAVPLAAGILVSCAVARPSGVIIVLASWLPIAIAGVVAVSAGWLPLQWFGFVGTTIAGASLVGGISGRLIADERLRAGVAVVVALSPIFVARFEPPAATAALPVTVTNSALVHAPAFEMWQELIGSDSAAVRPMSAMSSRGDGMPQLVALSVDEPRPFTIRRALFDDGTLAVEHVSEWDDAEHLRVVAVPLTVKVPRGLAAWRVGRDASAVLPTGATFDIISSGDSAATLTMVRTYRMAVHANAYPASWLADIAHAKAGAELGALAARSEARAQSEQPRLTAEMRVLRTAALRDVADTYAERGERLGHLVRFIDGERQVEAPEALPPPERLDNARAASTLRAALRPAANRARTTAWMYTDLSAGDSASTPPDDTLRFEFEDYEGRCIAEVTPLAIAKGTAGLSLGVPRRSRCVQRVMDERTRRSRLLAQLPLSAGKLEDSWSVALAATGSVRVYLDSVVVRADTLRLKAKPLDGAAQAVDSIAAGLSLGGEHSWSIVKRAAALKLDRVFAAQQEWLRTRLRFSIAIDSQFPLERSWPSFEVILRMPKTADNPYGVAWTYAHAPMAFFNGVRR